MNGIALLRPNASASLRSPSRVPWSVTRKFGNAAATPRQNARMVAPGWLLRQFVLHAILHGLGPARLAQPLGDVVARPDPVPGAVEQGHVRDALEWAELLGEALPVCQRVGEDE